MNNYRVYTDEKIEIWQRVGLTITAENESEVKKLLDNFTLFKKALSNGLIEYNGEVSLYCETENNLEFDHGNADITLMGGANE
jgi:hypothetical protein